MFPFDRKLIMQAHKGCIKRSLQYILFASLNTIFHRKFRIAIAIVEEYFAVTAVSS